MKRKVVAAIVGAFCVGTFLFTAPGASAKPLSERVNEAFRGVFGRNPTVAENTYWLQRVVNGDKTSFTALQGAMGHHKGLGVTVGGVPSAKGSSGSRVAGSASSDKNQLIKDVLPLFVKIFGKNPSNSDKAWWRKRISCDELRNETQLVNSMRFHKAQGVTKGRDTICGQTVNSSSSNSSGSGVGGAKIAGISDHPMGDQVRIGIWGRKPGDEFVLTVNNSFQIRSGRFEKLATLGKDDTIRVSYRDGLYRLRGSGIEVDTKSDEGIRIVPLNQGIVEIVNYSDKSSTIAGKNYNRFRGVIEIRKSESDEVWAINELRTEYYLRGLAETSGTGPEEYIKALGIAARTYVLYHKVVTEGRRQDRFYDIGKTADDQVYRGYEYEVITPRMSSIFNQVKGVIATNEEQSRPVSTIYFSDSDGRTRTAKEKWGSNNPLHDHLQKSVDDPHHKSSDCKGHCVGMSAQGAFGFAKADGWNYSKILNYFYRGIKLVKAY